MAKTVLLASVSILLVGLIIIQPDVSFKASLQGLTVWWNIVFPGLMPFLTLYEIMLAFGLVHAMGAFTQPVMRRLFKLPGEASLPLAIGWMGGYPAGPMAVASLRLKGLLTRKQGQRLLAISHMPNPLFMLVVIGTGFLHTPIAGVQIAIAVWLSAIWLLLLSALFSPAEQTQETAAKHTASKLQPVSLMRRIASAMHAGRAEDGRSFGKVLGDAVASSVQKLFIIGGLMIFAAMLSKLAEPLFALIRQSELTFIIPALFESHLGAYAASAWHGASSNSPLVTAAIAAIIAWSGISGLLQTSYATLGSDLKLLPFVIARIVHAIHAFVFTLLLWNPVTKLLGAVAPAFYSPAMIDTQLHIGSPGAAVRVSDLPSLWPPAIISCALLLVIAFIIHLGAASARSRSRRS